MEFGNPDDLPGGENERFLEYWNLVFMQLDQNPVNTLTPLPAKNIDTGLGLNRMASILQGTQSVFETDQFAPLIALGEELSGKQYGETFETDRALRILADHTRGMSFLVADGVVPSNEERGYVLRRLMRRAIVQGRRIGVEEAFLPKFADVVHELMASGYPELHEHRDTIQMWLSREEEAFNRTLEQGMRLLTDIVARARENGEEGIGADQAFLLHDTYGFPFDLTLELAAEQGLGVDEQGFEELMEDQRRRARSSAGRGGRDARARPDPGVRGVQRPHHVHRLRDARAGDGGRRPRARGRARCWRSSSSRRSTRPAAARWPTTAWSSARTATAARASSTSCGSATTRRWCSSRSRASCTRGSA